MVGLIILFILLFAFYEGYRRGLALQAVHVLGFVLSFILAVSFYQELGERIELFVPYLSVTPNSELVFYTLEEAFDLGKVYYAGVAFIAVYLAGWLLTKFVGILSNNLRDIELFNYHWVLAGALNVVIAYTMILMFLLVLTTLPIGFIQNIFERSATARFMVTDTPILSNLFEQLWVTNILH